MADSLTPSFDFDGGGVWTGLQDWPLIGIHATLTADNQLLTFGTDDQGMQGGQVFYDVWDYETDTHYTLPNTTGTDIFCSVSVLVPETGDILIIGGDARPLGSVNVGVKDVNVFHTDDMTLTPLPTNETGLTYARWYATAVTLSNGKILVLGGIDENGVGQGTPELYTPGGGFKTLDGAASGELASGWWYPRAWEASDGTVVVITDLWQGTMHRIDPSGDGSIEYYGDLPFISRGNLPAVLYREDEFLTLSDAGELWSVDFSGPDPVATMVADIGDPRYFSNMTILANGDVAVIGGGSEIGTGPADTLYTEAVIYSPDTGTVVVGDGEEAGRLYHSTAILLPDGSVLSLGGGAPGPYTNLNGEFYYPEMLFEDDGARADAIDIVAAPTTVEQRASFQITVDDPASVSRVTMVKSGTVTHTLNMETRFIEPEFTVDQATGVITIDPLDNSNVFTPGAWMVFVLDADGVPSEAATIMVGLGGERYLPQLGTFVTLNGTAELQAGDNEFLLTPEENFQTGSVVSNRRIDFDHDFTLDVSLYLGNVDAADGMTIVFHNDPYTSDAVGEAAGSLGVTGISNLFGIEFDTWNNGGTEVSDNHTGFITTNGGALTEVGAHTAVAPLENGLWHEVVVTWDAASQTMSYTLDGVVIGSHSGDLASDYFGGDNTAFLAITAATGGANNNQAVRINEFVGVLENQIVNTPPVAGDDLSGPILASALISGGSFVKIDGTNVLLNDSDPDGDAVSIVAINGVPVSSDGWQGWRDASNGGQITLNNADGRVQFRDRDGDFAGLPEGEVVETSLTYTLSDGNGGTSQATVTFVIEGDNVVGQNSPPVAGDDLNSGILTSELRDGTGTALKIDGANVRDNDSDPDGDLLSIVAINGDPVSTDGWQGWRDASNGGQIAVNTDGRVQFRDTDGDLAALPNGETVETSITYTVSDGQGGTSQATITFSITSDRDTGPQVGPDAVDDETGPLLVADLTDGTGSAVKINGENVLLNDFDANGDLLSIVEIDGVAVTEDGWQGWRDASNGGQIVLNTDGRVQFRDTDFDFSALAPGETVETSLSYTISDGFGGFDTASVTFLITEEDVFALG